jgi:hypothetical protein
MMLLCVIVFAVGLSFLLGTPRRKLGISLVSISGALMLAIITGWIFTITHR